ncbi:MAG: ATP-dependent DNA helicase RecG [Dehalococcoidia bacterium]
MTTTTRPDYEVLGEIQAMLQREVRAGYRDKLIIGGLDAYLAKWLVKLALRAPARSRDGLAVFPFRAYAATPEADRPAWIAGVAAWLDETVRPSQPPVRSKTPAGRAVMPTPAARAPKSASEPATLDTPLSRVKGFDRRTLPQFQRLGVETIRDALLFFPTRHLDRRNLIPLRDLSPGAETTVQVTVWDVSERSIGPRRKMIEAAVADETGMMRATWFNQPWVKRTLVPGSVWLLSGRVEAYRGRLSMTVAEHEPLDGAELTHTGRLVPIYPLTEGIAQRTVRRLIKGVVDSSATLLPDPLPDEVRNRVGLGELVPAVQALHYPQSAEQLAAARRRLAFDELFVMQLGLQRAKLEWRQAGHAEPIAVTDVDRVAWQSRLPFSLTGAQQRALDEIFTDLAKDRPMARLLQGDVGSGKTVIAALSLAAAVAVGGQGAILAPTEILANQHLTTLGRLLASILPETRVELLTGAVQGKKRRQILDEVAAGEINVLVGTHAVIQDQVEFRRLMVGVVDEQHRFGVAQRAALRHKGVNGNRNPHMLVMTATPIPRTLALTLYGDLDLSILDERPPGRQEIRTRFVGPDNRDRAYQFVREQVRLGQQAYVICPLVEESDKIEAKAATAEFERLRQVFPDLRLGLLHGRLKPKEKDEVMIAFRDGAVDVLVSTAVVEVGIDVPNATMMLIEGAERFGLSQLHQFRGRVGRGSEQSHCLLLSDVASGEGSERLKIVERTSDGFALAEEDLRLRGPGEFFGMRQSGLPELRVAQLSDVALLEQARAEAERILKSDPTLDSPDHLLLRAEFGRLWVEGASGDRS